MIRLRVRAGWSGPLLVVHTTLLEISCRGSFVLSKSLCSATVGAKMTHYVWHIGILD